ncbi:MAG TPA: hypothetical protein VFO71_01120 [Gemmatimonadales bacterium]|nr:hypothetical protein [Gemmatimonadales bacterium]
MLAGPEPPERELNPRLRRSDWRFLLPSPRPRRALCRAGETLADAVAAVAREVITVGSGADCDLVVAEDPDQLVLAELHAALRPGGACYTEWHSLAGGARRVERVLRAAGFVQVTCYRRWPSSAALPIYWIPCGARGATAYVRARRRLRGGRLRRLIAGARQRARDLIHGRYGSPICAVALRAGSSPGDELAPAAWLRSSWPEWALGPTPEELSTLLVTGGPRSVSKVVLLAFAEPSPTPLVAIKAPRVEGAAAGIRREGAVLKGLAARRSSPVPGAPRVLFSRETDGVPLVGETALAGRPLESLLAPRTLGSWSLKVAGWLAALAKGSPTLPASHWRDAIVEPMLSRFVEQFGGVVDPDLLRQTESIVRRIGALPAVPEQRDFGPWNLLVSPAGEIAVLDWESGEVDGLPALDLLYYLAYASFNVDRAHDHESRVASYRRSLDPATPTGTVRRNCLAHYLGAAGLDPVNLAPLRVLLWLIHAQSEFRHAAADVGGPPASSVLARGFFLALWAEEVRQVSQSPEFRAGR